MKDDMNKEEETNLKLLINRLLTECISALLSLSLSAGESSASAVTSSAPITRAYTLCILALLLSVIVIGSGQST